MVLFTRASKVVRMGLYGLMVRFSTFLDAPRRTLVPCLPERIAAVKRKTEYPDPDFRIFESRTDGTGAAPGRDEGSTERESVWGPG